MTYIQSDSKCSYLPYENKVLRVGSGPKVSVRTRRWCFAERERECVCVCVRARAHASIDFWFTFHVHQFCSYWYKDIFELIFTYIS
jgi:hypothetical protein